MKSKILIAATLVAALSFASQVMAQKAQNLGTQKREGVSSKINLKNEIQAAMLRGEGVDTSNRDMELIESCWLLLQNPAIDLPQDVQLGVLAGGQIMWEGTKEIEFHTRGKTHYPLMPLPEADVRQLHSSLNVRLTCTVAVFDQSRLLARNLVEAPAKKNEILAKHIVQLRSRLDALFKLNPAVEIGFFVEEGNAGFTRTGPTGNGYISPKINWMREVIFQKIAAYKTIPISFKYPCDKGVCEGKFVLVSDGKQLSVTRDGLPYLTDNVVGGIESSFDLGSERTLGTMKKIER